MVSRLVFIVHTNVMTIIYLKYRHRNLTSIFYVSSLKRDAAKMPCDISAALILS